MKKIILVAVMALALYSCMESGTSGEPVHHVSETGDNTSDNVPSGGVRTNPEATSNPPGDTTATTNDMEPKD